MNWRATLSVLSLIGLFVHSSAVVLAADEDTPVPQDVDSDHYAYPYYQEMVEEGVMSEEDVVMPDQLASRAYTVGILMDFLFPDLAEDMQAAGTLPASPFTDVNDTTPYSIQIRAAYSMGFITGDKDSSGQALGIFRPDDTLIRFEMVTLLMRMLDAEQLGISYSKFIDVPGKQWFTEPTTSAYLTGLVSGYADEDGNPTGYFGGMDQTTRAQVVKVAVTSQDVLEPNTLEDFAMDDLTQIESAKAHNGLVDVLDPFSGTVEQLYQAYIDLDDPSDIENLKNLYETVESHWQAIGNYYDRTVFDEEQTTFMEAYLSMRSNAELFLYTFKGFISDLEVDFEGTMVNQRFSLIESRATVLMNTFNVLVTYINAQATEE